MHKKRGFFFFCILSLLSDIWSWNIKETSLWLNWMHLRRKAPNNQTFMLQKHVGAKYWHFQRMRCWCNRVSAQHRCYRWFLAFVTICGTFLTVRIISFEIKKFAIAGFGCWDILHPFCISFKIHLPQVFFPRIWISLWT